MPRAVLKNNPGPETGWADADDFIAEVRREAPANVDLLRWDMGVRVSELIRRARVVAGLNQKQLAKRLDVSPSYVCQLESGSANPSVLVLARALRACGQELTLDVGATAQESVTELRAPAASASKDRA